MSTSAAVSVGYAAIGGAAVLAGAVIATRRSISRRAHALIQHAAAGTVLVIYLVMEELLREAHETDTGPIEVAVLFGGFLPFFLAGVAIQ